MSSKRLFGLLGSILGLALPGSAFLLAHPPIGWAATGGRNVPSLLFLSPTRGSSWNEPLFLVEPLCPGQKQFETHLPLVAESYLPTAVFKSDKLDGLYLCALVRSDGQIVRALIVDEGGNAQFLPAIESTIRAKWRFEARSGPPDDPVWQRVRLDRAVRRVEPAIL
ncbi:MAG TPA: hypothetical protein VIT45_13335 [Allosphingosinicella sp.]